MSPTATTVPGRGIQPAVFDDLIDMTGIAPGARLLKVGCGIGTAKCGPVGAALWLGR